MVVIFTVLKCFYKFITCAPTCDVMYFNNWKTFANLLINIM